jgi:hypothetical protein
MNVEIRTEVVQFFFWENIYGVSLQYSMRNMQILL